MVLEVSGRACVVIGGGEVAERKVESLLAAGGAVTVVSPDVTRRLESLIDTGGIRHVPRRYRRGDLAGAALAFVATGDPDVAAAVAREGRRRGVWVNAADDPEHCDFFLPSVLRRGPLLVAVATGGASPALARAVRERIERLLPDGCAALAETVADVRRELRARGLRPDAVGVEPRPHGRAAARDDRRRRRRRARTAARSAGCCVSTAGCVFIVGAGPGDPGLMTVRGLDLLRGAEVVVYDRLVNPKLLDEAPSAAGASSPARRAGRTPCRSPRSTRC